MDEDILVECKAIELHLRSAVLREPTVISQDLNGTIVKAYIQLLSTANSIDPNKEWFGIIVTYKEMYLGFGDDAWKEFLKEPIEVYTIENSLDINMLPPKNLFFMSVDNWDWTIQALKEGIAFSLKEILLSGQELSSIDNPQESVFMMEQVLKKRFQIDRLTLSYLDNAHDLIDVITK